MPDWSAAVSFIRREGTSIELARLQYLTVGEPVPHGIKLAFMAGQRPDGGWSPFWASGYSGVDATCFHLAQAAQLGIAESNSALRQALDFLVQRQYADGFWEEDPGVATIAPAWVKPGDMRARLYLTANAGFWIAVLKGRSEVADKAATYVEAHLNYQGHLQSFLHTYWLAGGLLWLLGRYASANHLLAVLQERLQDLNGSNLAWLGLTLLTSGVPATHPLVQSAGEALDFQQECDGRWTSEDGSSWDVHSTLEALRFLRSIRSNGMT